MSFYLGKDPNNRGIVHISKGYRTADELRGGIVADTIFHSDLPYVQYTPYEATLIPIDSPYTNINYGLSIPEIALKAMDWQVFCILIEHNGVIKLYETYLPELPYVTWGYPVYTRYAWTSSAFDMVSNVKSYTYRFPAIRLSKPDEVTKVWVVVLNTGTTYTTNTSETVYVGKGRFDVDGTSLAAYRYITPVPVNNTDPIVYTANGDPIQFVNAYVGSETSLSISINNDRTSIRSGDKEIFDSATVRGKALFDKVIETNYPGVVLKRDSTHDRVVATGLQNGDLFSFFWFPTDYSTAGSPVSLGVFRENTSITYYIRIVGGVVIHYGRIVCTHDGRLLDRVTNAFRDLGEVNVIIPPTTYYATLYK